MRETVFRKNFATSVKATREAQGLTQRELAEAAGIAEKYLSRLEQGRAVPSVLVAFRIAKALDASLDGLTGLTVKPVPPTLAAIMRLLRDRSEGELDRARRVLGELLR